jgi:hypothetical protein
MMKKIGTKLLIVVAVIFGGIVALQQPTTAHASNKISSVPSGHFTVSKVDYAFHWQTVKNGSKKAQVLVFGDFRQPAVHYAIPTKYKLSKNHRTLTTYYRLTNNGKLDKTTYRMDIYKYSNSKYKIKLNQYKAGLLPSHKGTSYTVSVTKDSPAQYFATTYTTPKLLDEVTANYTQQVQTQFDQGKTKADPSNADVKQQITDKATSDVGTIVKKLVETYNAR